MSKLVATPAVTRRILFCNFDHCGNRGRTCSMIPRISTKIAFHICISCTSSCICLVDDVIRDEEELWENHRGCRERRSMKMDHTLSERKAPLGDRC